MADPIKIQLLGGVEVSGRGVPPLSSRAHALLGCLVVHADAPQPRAHLAGLLWPDSDAGQARTNLRRELHHLRSGLGDTVLEVGSTTLTWHDRPGFAVDVRRFAQAREQALAALAADDAVAVEQHATAALAAYAGPFLPGCYDDWALLAREDLQRACVDLCDRAVTFLDRSGSPGAALDLARRRVALEPLEEAGYRQLMRLQHGTGDRAGAMNTYHRCASLLEQELGVSPSADTRRELDLALSGGGAAPPRAHPAPASPGLVGRDVERRRLLEAWEAAADGARFLVVSGEAGAGKTRLVADLAASVTTQGGVVAAARSFSSTGALPLAPVAQWLRTPQLRMACTRLPAVWRAEVARLVPEVDPDPTGRAGVDAAGVRAKVDAWQQLRFFEGLARAVVAVDLPVLLTLDDLQWGDRATLAWLSFLLSFARDRPLLVVATARADELGASDLDAAMRALRAARQVEGVTLGPLAAHDVATLATGLVGRELTGDELDLVCSVTAGNPFYVIEALRDVSATDAVRPADVQGMLADRLAGLSPQAQDVLGLASAVGRDFDLDLLIEASDLGPDLLVPLVDELWRLRILDQRGHRYDFGHDLLREAAYDAIPPARRWLLHRRLAQALELRYGDRVDVVAGALAEQYDRSGQPDRALPFYARAARQAAAVFAHAEAVRLWERCLELVRQQPAGRERDERELGMLEQLLPPLNALRGYADTGLEAHERRCAALGAALHEERIQITAAIALFSTTFVQGRTSESQRWGATALALTTSHPDLAGQAYMAHAGATLHLGDPAGASRSFARAVELAGESDSLPIGTRTGVHAQGWWSHALWLLGDTAGARATATEAVRTARRIEHPYSLGVALAYRVLTQQFCGDRADLAGTLAELGELTRRYGFVYYSEWVPVVGGWLEGGQAGIRRVRTGIDTLLREGALARMSYWLWLLADAQRAAGDVAAAVATLHAAEAYAVQHDDVWWLPEVLRSRAQLAAPEAAEALLDRAVRLATAHGSQALLDRCLADRGEPDVRSGEEVVVGTLGERPAS